jgi:hypothetical protein
VPGSGELSVSVASVRGRPLFDAQALQRRLGEALSEPGLSGGGLAYDVTPRKSF